MTNLPKHGLELRSTLTRDGKVEIALVEVALEQPQDDEAVVRVEAAPINPSDLISLLGSANAAQARKVGDKTVLALSSEAVIARKGRWDQALTVGLEGAGTIVAAGADGSHLVGTRVAALALSRGMFAQYKRVKVADCVPLPGTVSVRQGAAAFCNPLTALAIAETAKLEGHSALIQTAAASNLGQMLVKICREDDVPLVNIVRREEQVEMLRAIGGENIVNSSDADFRDQLRAAVTRTGARIAFDAIGGGTMVAELLMAMEDVALARMTEYSPYGSHEAKQVYIYGHLDPSPTMLAHEDYGLLWDVRNWYMPATMGRVGPERAAEIQTRAIQGITSTFVSHFSHEISLTQALDPETMRDYSRMASGQKYLINPTL